jgi:hypothetical protein
LPKEPSKTNTKRSKPNKPSKSQGILLFKKKPFKDTYLSFIQENVGFTFGFLNRVGREYLLALVLISEGSIYLLTINCDVSYRTWEMVFLSSWRISFLFLVC